MFASNEKYFGKKSFQKPNILRRKGKVSAPKVNTSNVNESPEAISLVTTSHIESTNVSNQLDSITILEGNNKLTNVTETVWGLTLEDCEDKQTNILTVQETDIHANVNNNASLNTQNKNEGKSLEHNALNIESFINSAGSIAQDQPISYDATVLTEKKTTEAKPKVWFDISNNSMNFSSLNNFKDHQLGDLEEELDSVIVVPSKPEQLTEELNNQVVTTAPTQSSAANYSNRAVKFKCDEPDCNKGFWSEEKLKKHKNSHKRQAYRTPTQITYECPVKKKAADGTDEKCPRTFEVRSDLLKHLDEDHTLEDAAHRCTVCGRRFFWAMGLRAHGTSLCARGGLACAWPGCGRVFRLPCRLREHARAHTGDRPYLCRYPDCGWAFRSASKLVRHARRHTDERRHACATCGRAFLRREHLRDHAARHHAPAKRAAHHCTHAGCEQTFTNMSTLYMHMKKVHRQGKEVTVAPAAEDQPATVSEDGDYVYLVSLPDDVVVEDEDWKGSLASAELEGEASAGAGSAGSAGGAGGAGGAEWHAARTHCTWPLARAHAVLDDDVHVGRAEGSVSDVYTVRSDLFLHGNVPIDDDSQQIASVALSGEASSMDADLCLIDAHPTIDLMQEELMYEDAADESSFRVFLMNGEELT
ncbi:hypothetical protein PYW07_007376 [Mythimna separata]|uniref:C2H2-type domain-containing protein n=1 Tax=Mythimna separata TaxID=271217 RepID=A0AAD7Z2W5_MYTSE|nr:hypothetical protein PYW07_007376 [Mythimna separata]